MSREKGESDYCLFYGPRNSYSTWVARFSHSLSEWLWRASCGLGAEDAKWAGGSPSGSSWSSGTDQH